MNLDYAVSYVSIHNNLLVKLKVLDMSVICVLAC